MGWSYFPHVLLLGVSTAVSLVLAAYAWRRREAAGATALAALMAAAAVWSAADAAELAASDLAGKMLWARVQYLGIAVVPLAWLGFALQFTGRGRFLHTVVARLLCVVPALTILLALTNDTHHWLWVSTWLEQRGPLVLARTTRGWWFRFHLGHSYLLVLAGALLLLAPSRARDRLRRWQASALLVGVLAPFAANVAHIVLGVSPGIDPTPYALTVSGIAFAWALFRLHLLAAVPVARDLVIESMADAMLVVEPKGEARVLDVNPAAARVLGRPASDLLGRPAGDALSGWPELLSRLEGEDGRSETAAGPGGREWEVTVSSVGPLAARTARVLVWRDVTDRRQTESALRAQKQLFENLVAVARATSERPTLDPTLQSSVDVAVQLTGATGGSLCLFDAHGAITRSIVAHGQPLPLPPDEMGVLLGQGLAGWVARNRVATVIDDVEQDARWLTFPDAPYRVRSVLSVPLTSGETLVGVISLDHPEVGHFGSADLELIRAAGDQMALAVRNAQMFDERAAMAERQTMLYDVLRTMGGRLSADEVARAAVETIRRSTPWPNVVVTIPGETLDRWTILAASRALSHGAEVPATGVIAQAWRTGRTQHLPDVASSEYYVADHPEIRSELAVPLRRGERLLGVLNIESNRKNAFTPDDVRLAESLSEALALALDLARAYRDVADEELRLRALVDASRDGILLVGLDRRILVINDSAVALLGLPGTPSDCVSLPLDDVLQVLMLQAPSAVQSTLDEMRRIRMGDEPAGEGEFLVPPRTIRWSNVPVRAPEGSLGRLLVFRDVTEEHMLADAMEVQARLDQQISEEHSRLHALIRSSRDGIVLFSADRTFLVVNEPGVGLLHLPGAAGDWVGRPVEDAVAVLRTRAPAVVQAVFTDLDALAHGTDPLREGEFEATPHVVRWSSLPVHGGDSTLGRLLVLRDITNERRLERMRDDLIHTMVHDLRNPLTAVAGVLEVLESRDASMSDMLHVGQRAARRMSSLVESILDVSRLESGQMPVQPESLALQPLVAETIALQAPLMEGRTITVVNGVAADLPPVWADPALVGRMLQNLVGNAVKFVRTGSVRVDARADGDGKLLISVSDNGPGIPRDLQSRLFEKFVTGRQKGHGSGLGLAFCRLAVEAQGGAIWLESQPGEGAAFRFTLPVARPGEPRPRPGRRPA